MIHPRPLTASLVLLAVALTVAVLRPRGWPEAVGAVPAAAAALALGLLSVAQARAEVIALGPTVGFLAAVLVLAWLCQRDGLFDAVGDRIAAASGGRPVVLLALVFLTCSTVTAALSLDTTVVLLTPVDAPPSRNLRALRPASQPTRWASQFQGNETASARSRVAGVERMAACELGPAHRGHVEEEPALAPVRSCGDRGRP